jgi:hypothetical protein
VAHSDYLRRLYPVTIVSARYGGVHEGAPWVAFARPDAAYRNLLENIERKG